MAKRRVRGSALAATGIVLATLLAMAAPTTSYAMIPTDGTVPSCGSVGHGTSSDCIRHRHLGTPTHGKTLPGQTYRLQIWLHPSLRMRNVAVDVQVRLLHVHGAAGAWRTTHIFKGFGGRFDRSGGWKTVSVKAPKQSGVYEVRTRLTWATGGSRVELTAASSLPGNTATSQATLLDDENCTNSEDDLAIIEYFNEVLFSDEIMVNVVDQGTSFAITVSCPQRSAQPSHLRISVSRCQVSQMTTRPPAGIRSLWFSSKPTSTTTRNLIATASCATF